MCLLVPFQKVDLNRDGVNWPQLGLCLSSGCICAALLSDPLARAGQPDPCGISSSAVLQEGVQGKVVLGGSSHHSSLSGSGVTGCTAELGCSEPGPEGLV